MTRPDRYDYIGMGLAAAVVALWVAHFALPAPPPDPSRLPTGPGTGPGVAPGIGPGIGGPPALPSLRSP